MLAAGKTPINCSNGLNGVPKAKSKTILSTFFKSINLFCQHLYAIKDQGDYGPEILGA